LCAVFQRPLAEINQADLEDCENSKKLKNEEFRPTFALKACGKLECKDDK